MKLYIVRHGQTTTNVLGYHSLESDDLTELGIKQAEELRERIKNMKFDIIICSPLIRTKHTADIININNNKEIRV